MACFGKCNKCFTAADRGENPYDVILECAVRRCCYTSSMPYGKMPSALSECLCEAGSNLGAQAYNPRFHEEQQQLELSVELLPNMTSCHSLGDGFFIQELGADVYAQDVCPYHGDDCGVECSGEVIPKHKGCKLLARGTNILPLQEGMGVYVSFVPGGPYVSFYDLSTAVA